MIFTKTCKYCHGTGDYRGEYGKKQPDYRSEKNRCLHCNGQGFTSKDYRSCKYCGDEPEQKISDQLKSLEGYINDIPLVIDPCKMCGVYKKNGESYDYGHQDDNEDWVEGTCKECCWFYDSKFEAGGTK